jgi:hypothetical protein
MFHEKWLYFYGTNRGKQEGTVVIIICTTCFYLKNSALHPQCACVVIFMILTIYSDLSIRWEIGPIVITYEARWIRKTNLDVAKINLNRPARNIVVTALPVASRPVVIYF